MPHQRTFLSRFAVVEPTLVTQHVLQKHTAVLTSKPLQTFRYGTTQQIMMRMENTSGITHILL